MLWILLVAIAVALYSVHHIINKHIISDELKDPAVASFISSAVIFPVFFLITLLYGNFSIRPGLATVLMFVGFIDFISSFLYFSSLEKGKVSRIIAIVHTFPIFVMILGFLFLGETFALPEYAGMIMIVMGSVLVSHHSKNRGKIDMSIMLAFAVAIIVAVRVVIVKEVTILTVVFNMLFWIALGRMMTGIGMFYYHHPHIIKKCKKGVEHQILNSFLTPFAYIATLLAISLVPASLVSSFLSIQTLVIFLAVIVLSKMHSKIISESLDRKTVVYKLSGILFIVTGTILALLFF